MKERGDNGLGDKKTGRGEVKSEEKRKELVSGQEDEARGQEKSKEKKREWVRG